MGVTPPRIAKHQPIKLATADADSRARTLLANERTFLAWIRTSISMIAIGVAAAQFLGHDVFFDVHVVTGFALLLVAGSMLLSVLAGVQFFWAKDRINRGAYVSATLPIMVTVGVTLLAGGIGVIVVLVLRRAV